MHNGEQTLQFIPRPQVAKILQALRQKYAHIGVERARRESHGRRSALSDFAERNCAGTTVHMRG